MHKHIVSVALPYVVLVCFCAVAYEHTVDDAYISFRYSENAARGIGLVFNANERVEGFSNPLWVYGLVVPALLGIDVSSVAKLLGIATSLGSLWLFDRLLERHFSVRSSVRLTGSLFLAGHISVVYYAVCGLETSSYAFLVLALQLALLEKRWLLAATVAGLAGLSRPEGVIMLAPLALGLWLDLGARRAVLYLLVPLTLVGLQLGFRRYYFGTWLPNTFYAKVGATRSPLALLAHHSRALLLGAIKWSLLHLLGGALAVLGVGGIARFWRTTMPMLASIGVLLFFIWYSVFDWMAFGRFYLPLLPLVLVYAFGYAEWLLQRFVAKRRPALLAGVACVGLGWLLTARALWLLRGGEVYPAAMSARVYSNAARYVRERSEPTDWLAAPEIGALAYQTRLRTLDELGLTDKRIPVLLGSHEHYLELKKDPLRRYAAHVVGKRPRFLVIYRDKHLGHYWLTPISASLYERAVADGYTLGQTFSLNDKTDLLVYLRGSGST